MNYQKATNILSISSKKIDKYIRIGDVENTARWLSVRSVILYELNEKMYDSVVEDGLQQIVSQMEEDTSLNYVLNNGDRIVFYDVTSRDRRGLSNQYVDALIDNKAHFLYLTENALFESTIICKKIIEYENGEFIIIPSFKRLTQKSQFIYRTICKYTPNKILLHILPWSIPVLMALSKLQKNAVIININITDHAFWAGASLVDYNIEFREYGRKLSVCERHFFQSQEFVLPYYPYMDNVPFEGFPSETDGKLILFWGSALYKVYDEEFVFFKLIENILKNHPNTVCLCAGGGNARPLLSFISEHGLSESWFYLGFRKDICQVIKHSDIIINTYPIGGGLICQYAAINSKPVISFGRKGMEDQSIEGVLLSNNKVTFYDKKVFLDQVDSLIHNRMLREKLGASLFESQSNKQIFSKKLKDILNVTTVKLFRQNQDKEIRHVIDNRKIDYDVEGALIKNLGIQSLYYYPRIINWSLKQSFNMRNFSKLFKS